MPEVEYSVMDEIDMEQVGEEGSEKGGQSPKKADKQLRRKNLAERNGSFAPDNQDSSLRKARHQSMRLKPEGATTQGSKKSSSTENSKTHKIERGARVQSVRKQPALEKGNRKQSVRKNPTPAAEKDKAEKTQKDDKDVAAKKKTKGKEEDIFDYNFVMREGGLKSDISETAEGTEEPQPVKDLGPNLIFENFYLGNRHNAHKIRVMELGITHVLNVSDKTTFLEYDANYDLNNMPMCDYGSTDLSETLKLAMRYMDNALDSPNGKILVHCSHGVNRSATITLSYLILRRKMTLREAWYHVKGIRPQIHPHDSYLHQLKVLEKRNFGVITLTKEDTGPSVMDYLEELRQNYAKVEAEQGSEAIDTETKEKLRKIDHVIEMNNRYSTVGARATSSVSDLADRAGDRDRDRENALSPRKVVPLISRTISNVEGSKGEQRKFSLGRQNSMLFRKPAADSSDDQGGVARKNSILRTGSIVSPTSNDREQNCESGLSETCPVDLNRAGVPMTRRNSLFMRSKPSSVASPTDSEVRSKTANSDEKDYSMTSDVSQKEDSDWKPDYMQDSNKSSGTSKLRQKVKGLFNRR